MLSVRHARALFDTGRLDDTIPAEETGNGRAENGWVFEVRSVRSFSYVKIFTTFMGQREFGIFDRFCSTGKRMG